MRTFRGTLNILVFIENGHRIFVYGKNDFAKVLYKNLVDYRSEK